MYLSRDVFTSIFLNQLLKGLSISSARARGSPQPDDPEHDGEHGGDQAERHEERHPRERDADDAEDHRRHGDARVGRRRPFTGRRCDPQRVDEALAVARHVGGPAPPVEEPVVVATHRVGVPPRGGTGVVRHCAASYRRCGRGLPPGATAVGWESMEIVLIRHGQPEWVRDGLAVVDPPLTDLGRRQAELLAKWILDEHFDEILVSPLVRARQTAAPLLEALGRNEVIDPWLEEIRDPLWHGSPAEKAAEAYAELRGRRAEERWHGLNGGESMRDFVARIRAGATEFLAARGVVRTDMDLPVWQIAEPGARIALIAHAGTNSVTIAHLLGLEPVPWEWDRFVLGHTSVSRVEALEFDDGFSFGLSKLSNLEHLTPDERTR